ncbi:nuclear pore complex protein Nup88 isoform X2 [Orussus abietinus]|nr:nuclear pore complex protein Nup88 isoform X2 [Orussus abietinus]
MTHNMDGYCTQFSTAEVRRARWHPGSTNDSHLLVLTSENSFHLYECELGEKPRLMKNWKVGPSPSRSPSKIPNFASLGDTAVDFDFATPTLRPDVEEKNVETEKINWNQIEWPILVLRENGDVFIVHNVLTGNPSKPIVLGSLSMYPPADDNYGIDSCSILCIQTTPPLVVIAACSGKIYHAILLREAFEDEDKKTWSERGSTYSLHTPDDALFVFECVEMELGLFFKDNDKKYSCSIHLHSDKSNRSRYFCSHNAGIHVVSLPLVSQLDDYIAVREEHADLYLPSFSKHSSSQYLVCTRTKHTREDEATPILGLGLFQEPCMLIALLHTGVVIDLTIVDLYYLPKIDSPEPLISPNKRVNKEPFDVHIRNLLQHEITQPITKLSLQSKLTVQEYLELLYRATHIFRTQHFVRHDKVREELGKKARTLKALKNHQMKELDILMETRKELQQAAEHLAERYEDIKDNQEYLARRAEEVLRLMNHKKPTMTVSERADAAELKKMDQKVKELVVRLEQLKRKATQQAKRLENYETLEKKKEIVLSETQDNAVKSHLSQMTKDIAELTLQVKSLEDDVEI